MKLASLADGGRDGRLVVVSRDLVHCTDAGRIAPTMQAALDDWTRCAPQLRALSRDLALEAVPSERFRERAALAPLPRAYRWLDGAAYPNPIELARRARGAPAPPGLWRAPLIYQGAGDVLAPPRAPIPLADPDWGLDFEAEIAVIAGEIAAGATREQAADAIRLVTLANDVSLRALIPDELSRGFGFLQGKGPTAFAPVAVTPDELGPAWSGCKLRRPVRVALNGRPFGAPHAGEDMAFDFAALIAHAARTRPLGAGAIVGGGAVSNRGPDGAPGLPLDEGGRGYSSLAEARLVEESRHGRPETPWLRGGDVVRIEVDDAGGHSIFGAIEQRVVAA